MVYHIYCDESRQTRDRYMAYSGLIVHRDFLPEFDTAMEQFRNEVRMTKEFKWTKVSTGKIDEYKRLMDYFFWMLESDRTHFKCLMIDNHIVNHRRFNNGDRELGFWKFYYQLLTHKFGREYCTPTNGATLHLRLDQKSSRHSLDNLKDVLNNGMASKHGVTTRPFRSVEVRDSKKSNLLQINDVVLGALGYMRNGYHEKPNASAAKREVAAYILDKAGLDDISQSTPRTQKKFVLWNFRLRK